MSAFRESNGALRGRELTRCAGIVRPQGLLVNDTETIPRSFLSRLSLGKIAELQRPRRHSRVFGTPFNFCPGPLRASRVATPTHAGRKECLQCVCDYSLDLVASRPAKVGDKLVTTKFQY